MEMHCFLEIYSKIVLCKLLSGIICTTRNQSVTEVTDNNDINKTSSVSPDVASTIVTRESPNVASTTVTGESPNVAVLL